MTWTNFESFKKPVFLGIDVMKVSNFGSMQGIEHLWLPFCFPKKADTISSFLSYFSQIVLDKKKVVIKKVLFAILGQNIEKLRMSFLFLEYETDL